MLLIVRVSRFVCSSPFRYNVPVRGLFGAYDAAPFDEKTSVHGMTGDILRPPKQMFTIPVPVQEKALKRMKKPKNLKKQLDKEKLAGKPVIISTKRKELNYRKSQTYGRYEALPLVSSGWYHRKAIGDHFTIHPFMSHQATNFTDGKNGSKIRRPSFSDYGLHPDLVKALAKCGYTQTTNIQHSAIPQLLEFRDSNALIASETGNGKTLTMMAPLLHLILDLKSGETRDKVTPINSPYAVIVTPGKELADQIGAVVKPLGDLLGLNVKVFKGGRIRHQISTGPKEPMDIVIGSYGALNKLFHEGYLRRSRVAHIGLDEVDTLLDDTFKEGTLSFIRKFGREGQSLLTGVNVIMTGATFPTSFDIYMSEIMDTDEILKISTNQIHKMMFHVPQKFMRVSAVKKPEALLEVLEKDVSKGNKVVIFANKGTTADFLQMFLNENNIEAVSFSNRDHYIQRRKNLDSFMTGEVKIICSTDLMSRGIDTHDVHHVINYDFPLNPADYIHRAGRVGRVSGCKTGRVTSLVHNPGAIKVLENLETSVRKNQEIQQVNNNIIRIIQFRKERHENLTS